MTVPSITAALTDARLLAPYFAGPSWSTWRAVLKAAEGWPLDDDELPLFKAVAGEREPPRCRVKELVVIAGRRSGKDSIASAIATAAATADYSPYLRPGERATVMCMAVDRDQAMLVHRYITGYFRAVPLLAALKAKETADGLELANDVEIVIAPNSFRAVRGRAIAACIMDEAAFWRDDSSANPDHEVYAAVRPGMVTLPGSMLILITTAFRRSGLAYQKWVEHFGKDHADVLCIYGPTPAFNPLIDQAEIDAALERDPEAAGAEWLSQWRDDLSGFLDRELVEGMVDRGVMVRQPQPSITYTAFCDPSGGRGDSFALAVAHDEGGVSVLDAVREWRSPFVSSEVVREAADLLRQYRATSVTGDRYAAGWVSDAFAKFGIRYMAAEVDASGTYLNFLPLLTSGRVRLLDYPRLVHQLASLERRVGRNKDVVDHPRGGHDDLAAVAAGALVLAASDAAPSLIRSQDLETDTEVAAALIAGVFATVVIGRDGGAGVSYFAAALPQAGKPVTVVDFGAPRMSAGLFDEIAVRLDQLSENYRAAKVGKPVRVALFVPRAFEVPAMEALQKAFAQRSVLDVQQYVSCECHEETIDAALLGDGGRLHFTASVRFGAGKIKFSAAARERMARLPVNITGAFSDNYDAVTLALLLGTVLLFEQAPSRAA